MASLKIYTTHSAFMDLGTTIETLHFIANNHEYERLFLGHIQLYLLIFSIPFKIFNTELSTFILIFIQTFIILSPIFNIYKEFGLYSVFIYIFNPIIYFLAFSTFHNDVLIIPFLYYFITYINQRKYNLCLLISILTLFIKETFAPIVGFCSIYILIKSKYIYKSLLVFILSFSYFIISTMYIIPAFQINEANIITGFESYGTNPIEILKSIILNVDKFIINIFANPLKIKFILTLLIVFPLSFIKFRFINFLSIPILLMLLSSDNENYFSFGHHYVAPLLPIFTYTTLIYLQNYQNIIKYYLIYSVFICLILSPSPFSRLFFTKKTEIYNYSSYLINERDIAIKQFLNILAENNEPNLVISIQNNILIPNLHSKHTMLLYPSGVMIPMVFPFKGTQNNNKILSADYVVIDKNRQPFLLDKSCDYYYGKCNNTEMKEYYDLTIKEVESKFSKIVDYDGFIIYKR